MADETSDGTFKPVRDENAVANLIERNKILRKVVEEYRERTIEVARDGVAQTLPEDIRVPLHELLADMDYLIGRVIADGSCGLMIARSIKDKLARIEAGVLSVAQTPPQGSS